MLSVKRIDQFARILRRGIHRSHARALFGSNRLEQRAKDLRFNQTRQQSAKHLFGRLFVNIVNQVSRLAVLSLRGSSSFARETGSNCSNTTRC